MLITPFHLALVSLIFDYLCIQFQLMLQILDSLV